MENCMFVCVYMHAQSILCLPAPIMGFMGDSNRHDLYCLVFLLTLIFCADHLVIGLLKTIAT